MLKGIIFDFDGVIAESVQVKSDAFAELYQPYGFDIVKKVVEHHEANGGMSRFKKIKYYHESYLNYRICKEEIMELAGQFSNLVVEQVIASPYVPGALEYIKKSYGKYKLFISTGTPTEEIKKILKRRNILQYFLGIYGSPESKINHIKSIIDIHKFSPIELLFFGDSPTDWEAAKANDITFILRSHDANCAYFKDYDGKNINNFYSLNIL